MTHDSIGEEQAENAVPSWCAPPAFRTEESKSAEVFLSPEPALRDASSEKDRPMISLSAGSFLMGTDYSLGLPADGGGPVRQVSLSPLKSTPILSRTRTSQLS